MTRHSAFPSFLFLLTILSKGFRKEAFLSGAMEIFAVYCPIPNFAASPEHKRESLFSLFSTVAFWIEFVYRLRLILQLPKVVSIVRTVLQ